MDIISFVDTPLGKVMLSCDGEALTGLWFEGQKHFGWTLSDERVAKDPGMPEIVPERVVNQVPVLDQTEQWLAEYFSGRDPDFTPKVVPAGTEFQRDVWDILLAIPYGTTVTYGEIAAVIARQRGLEHFSAQAVGNAVGRNPISLIIPCHRVVCAGGGLGGYAGGVDRKRKLLALEGALEGALRI